MNPLAENIATSQIASPIAKGQTSENWNFGIQQERIYTGGGIQMPGKKMLVKSDGTPLSVVGDTYQPFENGELDALVREALIANGIVARDIKRFSFKNDCRFVARYKVNTKEIGGQDFDNYFQISSSHDGSGKTIASAFSERLICTNGMVQSIACDKVSVRHTKNAVLSLLNIDKVIESALAQFDNEADRIMMLENITVSRKDEEKIIVGAFANREGEISTQGMNRAQSILDLAHNGRGAKGGSLGGLYHGTTDFFSHREKSSQESRTVGTDATTARKVVETIANEPQRREALRRGALALAN